MVCMVQLVFILFMPQKSATKKAPNVENVERQTAFRDFGAVCGLNINVCKLCIYVHICRFPGMTRNKRIPFVVGYDESRGNDADDDDGGVLTCSVSKPFGQSLRKPLCLRCVRGQRSG